MIKLPRPAVRLLTSCGLAVAAMTGLVGCSGNVKLPPVIIQQGPVYRPPMSEYEACLRTPPYQRPAVWGRDYNCRILPPPPPYWGRPHHRPYPTRPYGRHPGYRPY